MPNRLLYVLPLILPLLVTVFRSNAQCADSVRLSVKPVQCYGLRNGVIEVTEVIGDKPPYYFSLDGLSYSTRPIFDLLWAGEYILYVRDSSGCVWEFPVLVPEPPELRVNLSINDTAVVAGETFELKATVYPLKSTLAAIEWRPLHLFPVQDQLIQSIRVSEDTDFAIEIRNTDGCIARDNLSVPVKQTNLYFPNAFSPNSNQDNYFTLFAGDGVARVIFLKVFSRAGHEIFENRDFLPNDPLQGWNGKWRNRLQSPGTYVWTAQVEFLDGTVKDYSGSVALVN